MVISKVLVANRGEIAVRVIRAAVDAGLPSVAVYADADSDSPVRLARRRGLRARRGDPGRDLPRHGQDRRLAARSGANAVHPGYGFLAENADFAAGRDRRRADLDRSAAGGHRGPRRQGPGPAHRAEGRRAAGSRDGRSGAGRGSGRRLRRASTACRSPSRPPSVVAGAGSRSPARWRRFPSCSSPPPGKPSTRLRSRRVLRRALSRQAAARRDPVPGRHPRQRRRGVHPRLLAPAAAPEARRGGARTVPLRRATSTGSTRPPKRS